MGDPQLSIEIQARSLIPSFHLRDLNFQFISSFVAS